MLTLSIRQPWAWCIIRPDLPFLPQRVEAYCNGLMKPVENRTWPTSTRGRILIHAGKKIDREGLTYIGKHFPDLWLPQEYDCGGIIGSVELVDCVRVTARYRDETPSDQNPWFNGPYGFILEKSRIEKFTPMRGMLGFFDVEWPHVSP